ncbi:response regulator [Rhodococcoides corynebacterioides]|uniref:Transcriptional regulatory protein n=1 Tax=Rhodococcoides corynebacterioides TaxID=53972 RepID=A0ABS7P4K4_9NOCA|nr:response regulator [Rhodococcus corynebacterioides]MBY6367333.1 response regulator [Rhodococcus corynebacterioides]MBY6409613.1 response regulator [Rhodococcus corynebacterioides]
MPTVLVVDDDFMVADIHRRFVDHTDGFTAVGVAHTAAAALTAVAQLDPDLILLDVHLPDTSGLDVLRRLRAEKNPVGVIMITAARELDTVADALSGGAADYLIKPFEYPQLRDKLESFRARTEALESGAADQDLVDSLFGGAAADPRPEARPLPLPKGLSAETGRLVLDAVAAAAELSATECAEAVGISRVSARRYLEHYLASGALTVRLQYGRAGRPERRYRSGR